MKLFFKSSSLGKMVRSSLNSASINSRAGLLEGAYVTKLPFLAATSGSRKSLMYLWALATFFASFGMTKESRGCQLNQRLPRQLQTQNTPCSKAGGLFQ